MEAEVVERVVYIALLAAAVACNGTSEPAEENLVKETFAVAIIGINFGTLVQLVNQGLVVFVSILLGIATEFLRNSVSGMFWWSLKELTGIRFQEASNRFNAAYQKRNCESQH